MSGLASNPLPSLEAYIAAVRQSCSAASTALGLTPNVAAIDSFLHSLDEATYSRLRTQHGLSFPLRFPTPTAEVNFLGILALLNALSGYRTAFHVATGSGAYQNVVRLMIGLYISSTTEDRIVGAGTLTAKGMAELTEAKIVDLLGVSIHQERQHDTLPGVTVGVRGGDMFDAVQLVLATMNAVGSTLLREGYASLGAYLVGLLQQCKQSRLDDQNATDYLVRNIAQTLPEFRDTHTFTFAHTHTTETHDAAREVYLFKRIFFLLHSLHLRFADRDDWRVPNTYTTLPMFVDNVLPTLCVWFNLFNTPSHPTSAEVETLIHWVRSAHCNADLPRDALDKMQTNVAGPTLSLDETYAVRAATLHIGRVVVERAHELAKSDQKLAWLAAMNEVDLDGYLWAVAKDDVALRKVPRLVRPSIHF